MKPKFKNTEAWEQAQILMQPTFIRVLDNIRKKLEQSTWKESYEEVKHPVPGYLLCLTHGEKVAKVDIWKLCFRVCFRDYNPPPTHVTGDANNQSYEVDIDTNLIDETGEVDWQLLETKAQQVVSDVFANLNFEI